jgi:hypothetical protein
VSKGLGQVLYLGPQQVNIQFQTKHISILGARTIKIVDSNVAKASALANPLKKCERIF